MSLADNPAAVEAATIACYDCGRRRGFTIVPWDQQSIYVRRRQLGDQREALRAAEAVAAEPVADPGRYDGKRNDYKSLSEYWARRARYAEQRFDLARAAARSAMGAYMFDDEAALRDALAELEDACGFQQQG